MNIKKLFMSTTVTVMTLISATCFAYISKSDLNIGGFYYGQPWSEVIKRLGQPIKKEIRPPVGHHYTFQNGEMIFFRLKYPNYDTVTGVSGDLPSRGGTKAGIKIGSSFDDVVSVYGEPDYVSYEGRMLGYEAEKKGGTMLSIFFDKVYGTVTGMNFGAEFREGEGEKLPNRRNPAQQQSVTPMSTIPSFVTQIPVSELNLGWIEPGQPMSKAEDVYGKPGKIDDQGFFQIYNYNDKFIVKGKMNNGYKITSVSSYEKGVKTPSGFMVGDAYSAVVKKFGPVNGLKFKGEGVEAKLKGCTDYTYFSGNKQMVFLVDKKGIIQGIRVEELDEQKFIEAKRNK